MEGVPPLGTPVTVPTAGVPPVPGGTVMVTDYKLDVVPVVNA